MTDSDSTIRALIERETASGLLIMVLLAVVVTPTLAGAKPEAVQRLADRAAKGDPAALTELRNKAISGDPAAQVQLGELHRTGRGVPGDEKEAARWYRKAAEQGHDEAQERLGDLYLWGDGVPKDQKEAVKWYRKAANQGSAGAYYSLGLAYAEGRGVPRNDKEAVKWFRKGAKQGDPAAMKELGLVHLEGRGVEMNLPAAIEWLKKAVEQALEEGLADEEAEYALGVAYLSVPYASDYPRAIQWFQTAAGHISPAAAYNLGVLYAMGEGVEQDLAQAKTWFRKATEQAATLGDESVRKEAEQAIGKVDAMKAAMGRSHKLSSESHVFVRIGRWRRR